MPRTIFAGNWKMHKTASQTRAFIDTFADLTEMLATEAEIVIAPPFTALPAAHAALAGNPRIALGAQNVHWELQGAFTGDIAAPMLVELGVKYVIVGHSERREFFNELDRTVNLKVKTLLSVDLVPIVAVGETLEERNDGRTDERVIEQTRAALDGVDAGDFNRIVLAYEPIWAIGTGHSCDPAEADRVMQVIRRNHHGLDDVPILYGGSMKAGNVAGYMAQPHINGGLIGGASLEPHDFAELIRNGSHG
jgi:triosephosphate isomerase